MSEVWQPHRRAVGKLPRIVGAELNTALARAVEGELPRGVEVLLLPTERALLRDHIVSAIVKALVARGIVSLI